MGETKITDQMIERVTYWFINLNGKTIKIFLFIRRKQKQSQPQFNVYTDIQIDHVLFDIKKIEKNHIKDKKRKIMVP